MSDILSREQVVALEQEFFQRPSTGNEEEALLATALHYMAEAEKWQNGCIERGTERDNAEQEVENLRAALAKCEADYTARLMTIMHNPDMDADSLAAAIRRDGYERGKREAEADAAAMRLALEAVRDWYGLDGDGITDPVRQQVIAALTSTAGEDVAAVYRAAVAWYRDNTEDADDALMAAAIRALGRET